MGLPETNIFVFFVTNFSIPDVLSSSHLGWGVLRFSLIEGAPGQRGVQTRREALDRDRTSIWHKEVSSITEK